jgi:hypothetical protein
MFLSLLICLPCVRQNPEPNPSAFIFAPEPLISCATPILPSGPLGAPEMTGHAAEIAGHHPETGGHFRPKYARMLSCLEIHPILFIFNA